MDNITLVRPCRQASVRDFPVFGVNWVRGFWAVLLIGDSME